MVLPGFYPGCCKDRLRFLGLKDFKTLNFLILSSFNPTNLSSDIALTMVADTGLAPNALRSMSVQRGPQATPLLSWQL